MVAGRLFRSCFYDLSDNGNDVMKQIEGLLAVDVDGTLLTDHGHITDEVRSALGRATEAGWEVVIASGRTYYAAKDVAASLPFIRYAIVSNGASIMDVHSECVVHMETLSPSIIADTVETMRRLGAIPSLYNADQFGQKIYYDTLEGACEFYEWYVTKDPRCVMVDDVMAIEEDILQIGTIAKREIIFAVKEELTDRGACIVALPFESEVFGGKNHEYWFLQIVSESATKHNALMRLYGMLNIVPGRLVAVGDNYNDAQMISLADVGVAMGNAPDEIKRLARLVVGSNNSSGLSEVIDKVILSGEHFSQPN